jgi:GTP-binding protein HflX
VPDALFVSARTGVGIAELQKRCVELIAEEFKTTDLLVPHERYDVIARLHQLGHIQEQEHTETGVAIKGRFPAAQSGFFAPFVRK